VIRPKQGYWLHRAIGKTDPTVPLPPAAPGAPTKWEEKRSIEPEPATSRSNDPPIPVPFWPNQPIGRGPLQPRQEWR
jgi:hypothetical protein